MFRSRVRLVTGDNTVGGPGENKVLQYERFGRSGCRSEESPGISSGLLLRNVFPGLALP